MLETELIPATQEIEPRLMIVLHGLGDSMEGYRWLPEAMRLPWLSYLLVNAPDPYYTGFSWYDFENDPGSGLSAAASSSLICWTTRAARVSRPGKSWSLVFPRDV